MTKLLTITLFLTLNLSVLVAWFGVSQSAQDFPDSSVPFDAKDSARLNVTYKTLLAKVQRNGTVSIIVGFKVASSKPSQQEIAQYRQQLLDRLKGQKVAVQMDVEFVPYVGMRVDEMALRYLTLLPDVRSIEENEIFSPGLNFR